jgi:uncharacterized repeat protein (TIGR03803 family)
MPRNRPSSVVKLPFALLLLVCTGASFTAAQTESIIHSFTTDGAHPQCTLVADKAGNLYGTAEDGGTYGYGTVFELTPPAKSGGSWEETILHEFDASDGANPLGGLAFDESGNLFGAANQGGGEDSYGTVFELSPPAAPGGAWTFNVVMNFNSGNNDSVAINPGGPLAIDHAGNLYGVSAGGIVNINYCGEYLCGNVFELQPPTVSGGAWTGESLYNFETNGGTDGIGPSNVQLGPGDTLYGTTINGGTTGVGTLYKLTPPANSGGAWTERILYNFAQPDGYPFGGLLSDGKGGAFGTSENYGTSTFGSVFHLNPPSDGKGWTESILYNFTGGSDGSYPDGVISDTKGNLYGVTIQGGITNGKLCLSGGCGAVFELSPPTSGGSWTETTIHDFASGNDDGGNPNGRLLLLHRSLFGVTNFGGPDTVGTVFRITP